MKINIELSPLEFKHVTTSGSLEAMIDDLATVSAEVGHAIVKPAADPKPETQKQQKKDTQKTQKPDPKPEPDKEEETA